MWPASAPRLLLLRNSVLSRGPDGVVDFFLCTLLAQHARLSSLPTVSCLSCGEREDRPGQGLALESALRSAASWLCGRPLGGSLPRSVPVSLSVKSRSLQASCPQWELAEVQCRHPREGAALQTVNQAPRVSRDSSAAGMALCAARGLDDESGMEGQPLSSVGWLLQARHGPRRLTCIVCFLPIASTGAGACLVDEGVAPREVTWVTRGHARGPCCGWDPQR